MSKDDFQESFEQFAGLMLSSRSFLIYQPALITNNQLWQESTIWFFFEYVNKEQLKMVNINY